MNSVLPLGICELQRDRLTQEIKIAVMCSIDQNEKKERKKNWNQKTYPKGMQVEILRQLKKQCG